MKRSSERLIDVLVLAMLLAFGYTMREEQPALAGVITAAAVQFWLAKNATNETASHESIEQAAATAAAAVLAVAREANQAPTEVEVVNTEVKPVPIMPVIDKKS